MHRSTTEPTEAALPLDGGSAGACVEVDLLRCGEALSTPGWFFRVEAQGSWRRALGIGVPKSEWLRSPNGAFLLTHPTAGRLMVDAGLHPLVASDLRADFGRVNALFFQTMKMDPQEAVTARLQQLGVDAEDVGLVVMTHLHVDHASGMRALPNATFVCTEEEWRATQGRLPALGGYARRQLPDPSRMRTVAMSAGTANGPFAHTVDLFGDGSVRLISTPGHTVGHMSVLVRLRGGEALLAGDAVYTRRSLDEGLISWRTADDARFDASLAELRDYAAQNPGVPIIPTHDIALWEELRRLT